MSNSWLSIIGIGEDGVEGLPQAARDCLQSAELVIGGQRHLNLAIALIQGEAQCWASPLTDTIPQIIARRGKQIAVLASGDPFFFGVGTTLVKHLSAAAIPLNELRVFPQPSCVSLASALLGWPQQDVDIVSLCGRAFSRLRPFLRPNRRLLLLSADARTPAKVANYLCRNGFGESRLHLLEALGGTSWLYLYA